MDNYKERRIVSCILIILNVVALAIVLCNILSIICLVLTIVLAYLVGKTDGMNDNNHFVH